MICCLPLSATNVPSRILDVEFKKPNCIECERTMTDAISNFKGVKSSVTDSENQKIVVSGSFNLEKLVKKLNRLLSKEVEILMKKEKNAESETIQDKELEEVLETDEKTKMLPERDANAEKIIEPNSDEHKEMEKHLMFGERNPKDKCSIS